MKTARIPLWELDVECHGLLVGSCWTVAERRRLTDRLFGGRSSLDDFALHAAAATQCANRNKQETHVAPLREAAAHDEPPAGRDRLVQRVAELSRELAMARQLAPGHCLATHGSVAAASPPTEIRAEVAAATPATLASASVLCVGGRSGHVPMYRELVERHGGIFEHHDGGLKDNPHRLDSSWRPPTCWCARPGA